METILKILLGMIPALIVVLTIASIRFRMDKSNNGKLPSKGIQWTYWFLAFAVLTAPYLGIYVGLSKETDMNMYLKAGIGIFLVTCFLVIHTVFFLTRYKINEIGAALMFGGMPLEVFVGKLWPLGFKFPWLITNTHHETEVEFKPIPIEGVASNPESAVYMDDQEKTKLQTIFKDLPINWHIGESDEERFKGDNLHRGGSCEATLTPFIRLSREIYLLFLEKVGTFEKAEQRVKLFSVSIVKAKISTGTFVMVTDEPYVKKFEYETTIELAQIMAGFGFEMHERTALSIKPDAEYVEKLDEENRSQVDVKISEQKAQMTRNQGQAEADVIKFKGVAEAEAITDTMTAKNNAEIDKVNALHEIAKKKDGKTAVNAHVSIKVSENVENLNIVTSSDNLATIVNTQNNGGTK